MKWRRLYALAWAILLIAWAGYAVAGGRMAAWMAGRAGGALLRIGQGKFNDPAVFVQHRLSEALWLTTLLLVWIALHWFLARELRRRCASRTTPWVAQGLAGFILLNVWVGFAMHTALFWAVMGTGSGVENYMQFNFKRILFAENRSTMRAALVGSSQTRSEIDENLLNARLGTNLWTTELHFPGSKAYDLLLIETSLRRADPEIVICFFSENYLYAGSHGEVVPNFFGFASLPDAWRRGALPHLKARGVGYGLLGDVLPLFRCREIVSRRFLGPAISQLPQSAYDASLTVDLAQRARQMAPSYRIDAVSEFQKQAMADFVGRCQVDGRTVVLIDGGFNPLLMRAMDPAIRADMVTFLKDLQQQHTNVVVIPLAELVEQTPVDFEDLNHVTPDMQRRFTEALAGWLERRLPELTRRKRGD